MSLKKMKMLTLLCFSIAGVCFGATLPLWPVAPDTQAVIGRPLTPMSFAGVARRTTRRAVVGTAIATTPYPYPYPYAQPYPYAAPGYW
jgi:hypothetical protein